MVSTLKTKSMQKIPSILAGVAGEYFIAAELSRRGWIASISLRNTRGIDVLVTNSDASHSITIQCKTTQGSERVWMLNERCERFVSDDHFYVFVRLRDEFARPCYHVVPSKVVADHIQYFHQQWLNTPGREGRPHVDTPMRKYADHDNVYLQRWDLLGL
jgi:hypothetical protein